MADHELLRRAAERARRRPFYLAAVLLDWAESEGMDDTALAARLGCSVADLPGVLLCRRPEGTGPTFRKDVERIADRFGLDPLRLAEAIRYADALAAIAPAEDDPWLIAARDREPEPEQPPEDVP